MKLRKQLNIRLKEEFHTLAKVTAILKGKTLNDYIEEAIHTALEKDNKNNNFQINQKNRPIKKNKKK